MAEILLIDPQQPQQTRTIKLKPEKMFNGECLIGRDRQCCIFLDRPLVSRVHGKLVYKNGNYYYVDLGSCNNSHLNNQPTQPNKPYLLKPSDSIEISPYFFVIKSLDADNANSPCDRPLLSPKQYMPLAQIDPQQIPRWTKGKITVYCQQIIDETKDVKTFSFIADPPRLFTYKPGQFVTLELNINGKKIRRAYSLSSSPSRPHTLNITVKKVPSASGYPPGLVSNWLHEQIQVGSQITLKEPMGDFSCVEHPAPKLLFISAGSGITPMMSMARWLCDTLSKVNLIFVHSAPTADDIIFRQELELMATRHANFKLAITTTRSQTGRLWLGYTGRLDRAMLTKIAPDLCDRNIYVCGSDAFRETVKSICKDLKFPMDNYYQESFGLPKQTLIPPQKHSALLSEEDSLIPSDVPASFPLLEMLEQIPAPSDSEKSTIINSSPQQFSNSKATIPTIPKESISNHNLSRSTVIFSQSGRELTSNGEESILELAEEAGIDLPYGCGVGVCGRCQIRKLSGEVTYEEKPECDSDCVLTCIAKPLGRVVIEA